MVNEVVKYENQMNKISLRNFNSKELDVFMEICSRMRDKDERYMEFDFSYLKKLINWKDNTEKTFINTLESMYDKLLECKFKFKDKDEIVRFNLFDEYRISPTNKYIKIRTNRNFKFLLNVITNNGNFTRFELEEFVSFNSTYTKEFFRRMKQYRKGYWDVSLDEFCYLLDIPKSYKVSDIDKRVLKPILEELGDKYQLNIIKKYSQKSKRGRPKLIGFRFKYLVINKTTEDEENTPEPEKNSDIELLGEFNNIQLSDENYKTLLDELNGDEKTLKHLIECASEAKKSGKYKSQTDFSRVFYLIKNYKTKKTIQKYKIKTPDYIKQDIEKISENTKNQKEITEEDELAYQELMKKLNS